MTKKTGYLLSEGDTFHFELNLDKGSFKILNVPLSRFNLKQN